MYIIFKSHEKILIFPFESKEDDIPNVELHKTKYFGGVKKLTNTIFTNISGGNKTQFALYMYTLTCTEWL